MPDSPYFDGCYFDGTYFDASVCVPPVVLVGSLRRRIFVPYPPEEDDEDVLRAILAAIGVRDG